MMKAAIESADRASNNGPLDGPPANPDATRQRNNILSKVSDAKALIIVTFIFNAGMATAYFLAGGSANAAQTTKNTADIYTMQQQQQQDAIHLKGIDDSLVSLKESQGSLATDVHTLVTAVTNRGPGRGPPPGMQ